MPSEVVQMSSPAGHQKACGNGICIFGPLIVFRPSAALMNEPREFRLILVPFQLEQAIVTRRKQATFDAAEPSGKWLDWNTNQRSG